jgi:hypothetical protein
VTNSVIRFFGNQSINTTLTHNFATPQAIYTLCTILGNGKGILSINFSNLPQSIAFLWHLRLSQNFQPRLTKCSTAAMARRLHRTPKYWKWPLSFQLSIRYCSSKGRCRFCLHHSRRATMVFLTRLLDVLRLITQLPCRDLAQ